MKRPREAEVRAVQTTLTTVYICPFCKTEVRSSFTLSGVLMLQCAHCKNPIKLVWPNDEEGI
jgi:transcription elongation factor Elf1